MLQIGDKVVYPMHGAGVISGIENCEVLGEGKSYYVLEMPLGNMKLEKEPEKPKGSWNKRFHANLERMKSGDICDVAAVARNLILQDRRRHISSGERRLLDLAKQILVSELVYACNKTPKEIENWLTSVLSENAFAH